jgi:hypothetical protein
VPLPQDPAPPDEPTQPHVPAPSAGAERPPVRSDRKPVNWLLLVPLVVVLIPPLYNRTSPELIGIPFFYWYQLAVISVGVLCTYLVYRAWS